MESQSLNTTFAHGAASASQSDADVVFLYETSAMDSSAPRQDTDISIDHEMSDVAGDGGVADVGIAYQGHVLADQDSLNALERRLSGLIQPEVDTHNLLEMSFSQIPAHLSNIIAERDSAVGWAELLELEKTNLQTERHELQGLASNQAKQLEELQSEKGEADETTSRLRQELEQPGKDMDEWRAGLQEQARVSAEREMQKDIIIADQRRTIADQCRTIADLRRKMAGIKSILRNDDSDSSDDSSDEEDQDDADDYANESEEGDEAEVSTIGEVNRSLDDAKGSEDEQRVSDADFYDRVNDHTRQASPLPPPPKPKNFKAFLNAAGELEFVPCNGRARTARYHKRREQGKANSILTLMDLNNVGQAQDHPA